MLRGTLVLASIVTAACSGDLPVVSPEASRASLALAQDSLPADWATATDDMIWREITRTDTSVRIGLKEPGTARGVARGRPTLSRARWRNAIAAIRGEHGSRVRSADTTQLPVMVLTLPSFEALQKLRRLPFVDYVEPRLQRFHTLSGGSGCGSDPYNMNLDYVVFDGGGGDVVSQTLYGPYGMNIFNAWKLTAGAGVALGLTDTGIDTAEPSEFSPTYASSGLSSVRQVVAINGAPTCDHGSRVGALAAAPRNGRSIVGVAYQSHLISYRHANDVVFFTDAFDPVQSINEVAMRGAKVISMAWGMASQSTAVTDFIAFHYENNDVAFFGAAGTCGIGDYCPHMETAVYPASLGQVFAVTGANHDGSQPNDVYNYGDKQGVLAFTDLATIGLGVQDIRNVSGSSAATGIVSGAAALIRAYNPSLTAPQVYQRIQMTSGYNCGAPQSWRSAMINVSAAVGGPCVLQMLGNVGYTVNDNLYGYMPEIDYWVLTRTGSFSGMNWGGSGSYTANWIYGGGIVVNPVPTEGSITDMSNNTYWQTRRKLKFQPAYDGLPYSTKVVVQVTDNVLGTVDERSITVNVCSYNTNCYQTTRLFPTPPPPPSGDLTFSISGPSPVRSNATCVWFVPSVSGGTPPYSYEWRVNNLLQSQGSSNEMTYHNGTLPFAITATVTDGSGAYKTVTKNVAVSGSAQMCAQ